MYVSLCDFVCIPLLLQFVLGICLSGFFVLFFSQYSFQRLLPLVDLLSGLAALFFLSFFFIFNN